MDEKTIHIFDEIFGALDDVIGDGESNGLEILGAILATPDEQFEVIQPVLCNSIEDTFNSTDAQIAFAQMMNINGVKVEDFTDNLDKMIEAVNELTVEEIDLSESKKDFLKFVFTTFINAISASERVSNRIVSIPIELCRESAKLPSYATAGSAAMDIYSPEEYTIAPGECKIIPTGLKVNIPKGYALLIQPRSGLSRKTKLRVANTPGLIDSDYHEEIGVIIENIDPPLKDADPYPDVYDHGPELSKLYGSSYTIGKGERFAQMRLVEVPMINWLQVNDIGHFENDHGEGFGSTGTN